MIALTSTNKVSPRPAMYIKYVERKYFRFHQTSHKSLCADHVEIVADTLYAYKGKGKPYTAIPLKNIMSIDIVQLWNNED